MSKCRFCFVVTLKCASKLAVYFNQQFHPHQPPNISSLNIIVEIHENLPSNSCVNEKLWSRKIRFFFTLTRTLAVPFFSIMKISEKVLIKFNKTAKCFTPKLRVYDSMLSSYRLYVNHKLKIIVTLVSYFFFILLVWILRAILLTMCVYERIKRKRMKTKFFNFCVFVLILLFTEVFE